MGNFANRKAPPDLPERGGGSLTPNPSPKREGSD